LTVLSHSELAELITRHRRADALHDVPERSQVSENLGKFAAIQDLSEVARSASSSYFMVHNLASVFGAHRFESGQLDLVRVLASGLKSVFPGAPSLQKHRVGGSQILQEPKGAKHSPLWARQTALTSQSRGHSIPSRIALDFEAKMTSTTPLVMIDPLLAARLLLEAVQDRLAENEESVSDLENSARLAIGSDVTDFAEKQTKLDALDLLINQTSTTQRHATRSGLTTGQQRRLATVLSGLKAEKTATGRLPFRKQSKRKRGNDDDDDDDDT
jgi:hypothetical protein